MEEGRILGVEARDERVAPGELRRREPPSFARSALRRGPAAQRYALARGFERYGAVDVPGDLDGRAVPHAGEEDGRRAGERMVRKQRVD